MLLRVSRQYLVRWYRAASYKYLPLASRGGLKHKPTVVMLRTVPLQAAVRKALQQQSIEELPVSALGEITASKAGPCSVCCPFFFSDQLIAFSASCASLFILLHTPASASPETPSIACNCHSTPIPGYRPPLRHSCNSEDTDI